MGGIRLCCKILISFLFASCSITGLTDGYSKLSQADKARVGYASLGDTISKKILMVSGAELLNRLDPNSRNVVYYYNSHCRGERCLPLSVVDNAIPKDVRLYVVSRELDHRVIKEASVYTIYGIDKYHYASKYLFKYEDRFLNDLTGRDNSHQDTLNLYLFEGRRFVQPISIDYKF